MKNTLACRTSPILFVALMVVGLMPGSTVAIAQAMYQDVYSVTYFSNAGIAGYDANIRIEHPGVASGNLCAMIYVFDSTQELTECCGCQETPNGLRMLSINVDLDANPLTGLVPTAGIVDVVSAAVNAPAPAYCDPTGNVSPTPSLRTWATHVQVIARLPHRGLRQRRRNLKRLTETNGQPETLSADELGTLQAECYYAQLLGSGRGICTCGFGE